MGDPLDEVKQYSSKDEWRNTHLYDTQGAKREASAKVSYTFQMHGSKWANSSTQVWHPTVLPCSNKIQILYLVVESFIKTKILKI